MKTRLSPQANRTTGLALILVLCITGLLLITLAATINRTAGTSTMNARNNQFMAGLYAAESATEKAYAMMEFDFLAGNLTFITNDLAKFKAAVPTASESSYWSNWQFSDGAGHLNANWVSNTMSQALWGPLRSQYSGMFGWTNVYRVVSNAKQLNTLYSITNAVQQDIEMDLIPVFQFAIFYNSLLEFVWCAPFTINGPTHANADIYVGSIQPLTFNSLVTMTGSKIITNWFGHQTSDYTSTVTFNAGYSTNAQSLTLPIGTNNTPAAVREIINMPPAGESITSALGQQRYFNKADIVLLITNVSASAATVTVSLRDSASDSSPTNIVATYYPTNNYSSNYVQVTTNFPFLTVTNTFTDQREGDTVLATDIDMTKLQKWMITNTAVNAKFPNTSGLYSVSNVPNILYVADNRSYNSSQLTAVRLKNGSTIPTNMVNIAGNNQATGFTVATPNPLYVQGNYNCPANAGSTNTTAAYPASLVSDALTILSGSWADAHSNDTMGSSGGGVRTASTTTVNAAIITGVVYSTGSGATQFSGGVQNLPRLLEDWGNGGSTYLWLNTSIVNLFNSARATNQFRAPGGYYFAPSRQFSFDLNYLNYTKQPPGTPMLGYVLRCKWAAIQPGTVPSS